MRVRPSQQVPDPVDLLFLRFGQHRRDRARGFVEVVAVAVVMAHDQTFDARLHGRRQFVIGEPLVGEGGAVPAGRHFERVQHGATRRHVEIRIVGVKIGAGVSQPDGHAVAHDIGQDQDVGFVGVMKSVDDMRFGPAPVPGKIMKLPCGQRLLRKHHDAMFVQGPLDAREAGVGQRLRQIDAGDARAERVG